MTASRAKHALRSLCRIIFSRLVR